MTSEPISESAARPLSSTECTRLFFAAMRAARTIADPYTRALTLQAFIPEGEGRLGDAVADEAAAAARAVEDEVDRAQVRAMIAAKRPERRLVEALAGARALPDGATRAAILAILAPCVPPAQREGVVAEALAALEGSTSPALGRALRDLAPLLPGEAFDAAVAQARTIEDEHERVETLAVLASVSLGAGRDLLLEEVVAGLARTEHPACAELFAGLAENLPAPTLSAAWSHLVALPADDLTDVARLDAMCAIARRFPADRVGREVSAILSAQEEDVADRLAAVAGQVPDAQVPDVWAAAQALPPSLGSVAALSTLAGRLQGEDRQAALADARAAADALSFDDSGMRAAAFARLAAALSPAQRESVLASELARLWRGKNSRRRVFSRIADADEAVRGLIVNRADDGALLRMLYAFAAQFPATLLDSVVETARKVESEETQAWIYLILAPNICSAIADYSETIRLVPSSAVAYYECGVDHGEDHEHEGAIAGFSGAIRLDPTFAAAYYERGVQRGACGDWEGAIEDHSEAIRLDPNFVFAYRYRGFLRGESGDWEGAIEDHSEAIRLDPNFAFAYHSRGVQRGACGDRAGAISDYSEAVRLDPNFAAAYHSRGVQRGACGDRAGAIADYSETIRLDPTFAAAYYERGVQRGVCGDCEGAIADHSEVIRLDPNFAFAYHSRGVQRGACGDRAGAISDCSEAIRLDPNFAFAYHSRGVQRSACGDRAGAISDYSEAIRLDPNFAAYYYERGFLRGERGDHEGAIANFETCVALAPDDPVGAAALARERTRQGLSRKAFNKLSRIIGKLF